MTSRAHATDQSVRYDSAAISLTGVVVERLPVILSDVRALLQQRHPGYADFLEDEFDEVLAIARGISERLIALVWTAPESRAAAGFSWLNGSREQVLFARIGIAHCQQDGNVNDLLAAYRSSAAIAWRHFSRAALDLHIPTERVAALADAVLSAVDELSRATLHGYTEAQLDGQLEGEQRCRELAELLLSDHADTRALRRASACATWPLPASAAVVLIERRAGHAAPVPIAALGQRCLVVRNLDDLLVIVPDANGPGQRTRLARALQGTGTIVGPTVPLRHLPASRRLVTQARALRCRAVLEGDPLFVDDHLAALLVHQDEPLLAALHQQYLHPLTELPEPTRERLINTLSAWLLHMGNHKEVAATLHIHPQTVRYRLNQLRELIGPALDDAGARASLMLSVVWGPPLAASHDEPDEHPLAHIEPSRKTRSLDTNLKRQ